MSLEEESMDYHQSDPPGKIEITTTKPTNTQRDLSLAYSPGVAGPCRAIASDPESAYQYTAKGNLVGVVSNGSAVLGLGDIGPQASKPVMEGKGVLFKRFADIDVFDIELNHTNIDAFVDAVAGMEPTFGGINIEDVSAPECFVIEERLRERIDIPVFHDDQHGTAIISGAALLNATEVANKDLESLRVTFAGAGAAAVSSARFYVSLGVDPHNITMYDIDGILTTERADAGDLNEYNREFARDIPQGNLATAIEGADVFVGLSAGGIVDQEMVRSMADNPIIFAMANPTPEIGYEAAKTARDDTIIMATGRSDYPNQVNNVLGFPFIFRGALDVRATEINETMKVAAAKAIADLAKQDVPDAVVKAYGNEPLQFGPDYIIPKPLDARVLFTVAPAVAQAAIETGVARTAVDESAYVESLEARLGKSREMMRIVRNKAKTESVRLALAEGADEKIIRAASQLVERSIAQPVLIGTPSTIARKIEALGLKFEPEVIDPTSDEYGRYVDRLYELRQRKGVTHSEATELIRDSNYFASVIVECGDADAMLTGLTYDYPSALRPPLQVIGTADGVECAAGVYMLTFKNRVIFIADATVNQNPDATTLAEITRHAASVARQFDIEPRAALLSYSDFGSVDTEGTRKPRQAAAALKSDPDVTFPVDGEMQADTAVTTELLEGTHEFSTLEKPANVLVLPNLEAGNIVYKLLSRLGGAQAVGPMLVGMDKPVHVLQRDDEVKDIVNLAAVAAVDAQERRRYGPISNSG